MFKPLSEKTIQKQLSGLGISQNKIDTLYKYFNAFTYLYGCLTLDYAWDIFKYYEGSTYIRKMDFIAFSGIIQREAGLPYYIKEINEIYSAEKPEPQYRMIVHKSLISVGIFKYHDVYIIDKGKENFPPYLPEKDVFLSFSDNIFYKTKIGKKFAEFICALKTNGVSTDKFFKLKEYEIKDIEGNPVKGKRLDKIIFYKSNEQFDIEYYKSEAKKKKLIEEYSIPSSKKLLNYIQDRLMVGKRFDFEDENPLNEIIETMKNDYGVVLDKNLTEKFVELFTELNNTSNLWCKSGWSPIELMKQSKFSVPRAISFGSNMKQMFASGELNYEEYVAKFKELGIDVID